MDDYEEKSAESVRNYIVRGSDIEEIDKMSADELIAGQLQDCHYFIMTANRVESQAIKRLLYEEAKDRKIYKFWMAAERNILVSDENDPKDPVDGHPNPFHVRSPRLLEINCGEEVQYYFVTIGATEPEIAKDPTLRAIKIAYICPTGTSSFTGNGSHKAVVHALRRFSDKNSGYPFIASLGVAFGLNPSSDNQPYLKRQCLGDVLISQSIIAYDSKYKVTEPEEGRPRGNCSGGITFSHCEVYPLEVGAKRAFAGIIDSPSCSPFQSAHQRDTVKEFEEKAKIHMDELRCHFGPLYSGGAVVSSMEFKKMLLCAKVAGSGQLTQSLDPIGGEMEGVGIWYACLLEDDQFPCIVIKGICDWGEEKNGWAELLAQEDPSYLEEKFEKKLAEVLDKQFQYEEEKIVQSLISGLMGVYKQSREERTKALSAIVDEAEALGIYGGSEVIQNKLEESLEQAKLAVNDLLKDAVQAYATEQAFKMYCYMVYEDPQLGKIPAKTPNESKKERELKQLQQAKDDNQQQLDRTKEEVIRLKTELENLEKEKLQDQIKTSQERAELEIKNEVLMAHIKNLEELLEAYRSITPEVQNGHAKGGE